MTELTREEAEAFIRAIVEIAQMADRVVPQRTSPLSDRLIAHLGGVGDDISSTSMSLPLIERVNVQLALNALEASSDLFEVRGLQGDVGNYGGISLAGLITGMWHGPGETARQYVSVDVDVDETIDCLKAGLVLTEFEGSPTVIMIYPTEHRYPPELIIEVVGVDQASADGFLRHLRALMHQHNAFRRKVVSFSFGMHGEFGLSFVKLADVGRNDVVLGPGELEAIEGHTIGITEHAEGLRAAGQHVKRGLLLYGPPGTGKSHTIAYLTGRMSDRTTIILSGAAVGAVGQAGTIARALQPATIIVEDVDLIAMDRQLPGGQHNALLFQLLNEMDGLAEDADVLFVLTTNQVDMLEPALAARPGRVDQAIELSLPDAESRRRLLELYTNQELPADGEEIVRRLDGAAPAFIKELARRAELMRLNGTESTASPLTAALDAMIENVTPTLRRSLAGPPTADDEPASD